MAQEHRNQCKLVQKGKNLKNFFPPINGPKSIPESVQIVWVGGDHAAPLQSVTPNPQKAC